MQTPVQCVGNAPGHGNNFAVQIFWFREAVCGIDGGQHDGTAVGLLRLDQQDRDSTRAQQLPVSELQQAGSDVRFGMPLGDYQISIIQGWNWRLLPSL